MTSLFPPGAGAGPGGGDPKGPVREPLHPDELAGRPRPTFEPGEAPDRPGVGLFRHMSWGWWVTLALALGVVAIIVFGLVRTDPARNPAPAAYVTQGCAAFGELSEGTDALGAAVDVGDDRVRFASAAAVVDAHVAAAGDAIGQLPSWPPGEQFEQLLASLLITLLEGSGAVPSENDDGFLAPDELTPEERVAVAENLVAEGREMLDGERLGFSCAGEARGAPTARR